MKKQTVLEPEQEPRGGMDDVLALREKYVIPFPGPMFTKPVQIVKGRGQFLYDERGKKYLDGFAGVATVSIGHSHPHFVKKVTEQAAEYFHNPFLYVHPALGRYAQRLVAQAKAANPALEMCYFTNSGSEANEVASIIAKNYTGGHDFVALRHSYHGRTLMTMALTGQAAWRHSAPYAFGVSFAQANYTYRRPSGTSPSQYAAMCVADLSETIRSSTSGRIAAFYAEPINGVGGVITPEPEYFPEAYEVVKRHGGLFIADEVQTGVGRTGNKFLGIEHWGVKPDIVTMAKGLANGYPIGAVITTREIATAVKGKLHYNTFGGGPVAMAAAGAVLDVLEQEKLALNAAEIGGALIAKLSKLVQRHPAVGDVRGKGLMIGVEIVKDKKGQEPAPETTTRLLDHCKENGLLLGKGGMANNVLRVKPPLCVTKKDADFIVDVLEAAIKEV